MQQYLALLLEASRVQGPHGLCWSHCLLLNLTGDVNKDFLKKKKKEADRVDELAIKKAGLLDSSEVGLREVATLAIGVKAWLKGDAMDGPGQLPAHQYAHGDKRSLPNTRQSPPFCVAKRGLTLDVETRLLTRED